MESTQPAARMFARGDVRRVEGPDMVGRVHSFLFREGIAFLSVGIATVATWAAWPNLEPTITPFFLAAVTISGWLGGLRGGLLAALLSTIASFTLTGTLGGAGELGFASVTWTASFLLIALLT